MLPVPLRYQPASAVADYYQKITILTSADYKLPSQSPVRIVGPTGDGLLKEFGSTVKQLEEARKWASTTRRYSKLRSPELSRSAF
jgi:hypothetical protein